MNKLMEYLSSNPKDALAIREGRAMPIERLSAKELLQVIKTLNSGKISVKMGYWG